ncbi:MAG: TonB-dependent receptor [Acidobacteriaceae bacterium]|nr:TonB-dependent receptor [Acidobacteriaceae bacterium]
MVFKWRSIMTWVVMAVFFVAFTGGERAAAQSSSAGVVGSVSDASGARLPGAKLVLTNVDTNVVRETTSNNAGDYTFAGVPPARYTLAISAASFQTQKFAAFEVAVDQKVNIAATLKPGDVATSVTVEAEGAQVESTTAQLGTVIGTQQVNNLPLNGRNFTQLLQLTPGATPISTGQNAGGSGAAINSGSSFEFPAINGQNNRSTLYLVDGINDNNSHYNEYAVPPIIDVVQEFKINTHNDAQYGQVLGGVVNIITKSGTNSLHGSAWEFIRNNDFDAHTYFPSATNQYHQNQFGAQAGGPVLLPKIYNGRNKTFFEVGFEGFHYSKAAQSYYLQPTAAQLGESTWGGPQNLAFADFSPATTGCTLGTAAALATSKCQLYNPTGTANANSNRPAFAGNQIPVSLLDPHAVAFVNAVFGPPITIPGISPTVDNGQITTPTRQSTYNYTARIDQHLGDHDFLFARYSAFQSDGSSASSLPHLFGASTLDSQQYGVSWTHVFGPTLTAQVQYGRSHISANGTTHFDIANITGIYGMDPAYSQSYIDGITVAPILSVSGGFSGGETNSPSANLTNIHEYLGSVTKTHGRHTMQAGGGWDQFNYGSIIRQGTITFSGASTANFAGNPGSLAGTGGSAVSAQSGLGLADFLLDQPNAANKRNVNISLRIGGVASIYLQDSWKLSQKLTMTYGLRYDRTVWPQYGKWDSVGKQGSIETGDFDFNNGTYILQVAPPTCAVRGAAPCLPSAVLPPHVVVSPHGNIIHGTKTNVGPRIGMAYAANSTLAIRAGFGIVFDNWSGVTQEAQNFQGSWPDIGTLAVSSLNTPGTSAYTTAQNPFGTSSGIFPGATPFGSNNSNYNVDPLTKNPYSVQYNLGFQQQLGRSTIFEMNYVGSESHRLDLGGYYNTGTLSTVSFATRQAQYNANPGAYGNGPGNNPTGQPYPYIIPVKYDHSGGNGTYNALQVTLTRRFSQGLSYNLAYTWSKAIDEGVSEYFGAGGTAGVTGASLEDPYNPRGSRGPSSYNIPHLLTLGLSYAIPVGKNGLITTGKPVADYLLGNWEVGTFFVFRSGQNFSVSSAGDIGNTGNGATYERANLVGNPWQAGAVAGNPTCTPPAGPVRTKTQWFNPCAFATPAPGTLGDSGRSAFQAQKYNQLDASVSRIFPIYRELQFKLRVDAFNSLNHPVLNYPGALTTTPSALGQITSTANSQRQLQFSGKIVF